jgi:hypothetical protein
MAGLGFLKTKDGKGKGKSKDRGRNQEPRAPPTLIRAPQASQGSSALRYGGLLGMEDRTVRRPSSLCLGGGNSPSRQAPARDDASGGEL